MSFIPRHPSAPPGRLFPRDRITNGGRWLGCLPKLSQLRATEATKFAVWNIAATSIGPRPMRLRLDTASYQSLRQKVLRRDGWRCQACGTMSNLEVHHKQFRSHSGHDSEENLITLCVCCHGRDTFPEAERLGFECPIGSSIARRQKSSRPEVASGKGMGCLTEVQCLG